MTTNEKTLLLHEEWKGKLKITSKTKAVSGEDLTLTYTPGVAEPCKAVAADPEAAHRYTIRSNTAAIVSDGSAVLGLDNIGPLAVMPVTEGKAVLFKEFGGVNAFPIYLDARDTQETIGTVTRIAPAFGSVNLGDISTPGCFEIGEALKERLDIPVFHDDQHGTAIMVLADVINSLKLTGKKKEDCRVVVDGADSAGITITKLLLIYGFAHITMCDRSGILSRDADGLNWVQEKMMDVTNLDHRTDTLADAMRGADIFVGVSTLGIVTQDMVAPTSKDTILLAMANPVLKIMPELAEAVGARVVGTDRFDFPNQVDNVMVFLEISKDALESRASVITGKMKLAAAEAIAGLVDGKSLSDGNVPPEAFDPRVTSVVSNVVKDHIRK